ncbi:MAG: helix-turn-helix transcriptional regulator [bacterium]
MNNKIEYLRKSRKITQVELAKLVGVSRQTIISLEQSKHTASLELAYKISQVFNLSIEDVFDFNSYILKK